MAIYNYKCRKCDHEFSEMLKMDDRKKPTLEPCPSCNEQGDDETIVYQVIGTPKIVAGVGTNIGKSSQGWKDLLGRIKKGSGKENYIRD